MPPPLALNPLTVTAPRVHAAFVRKGYPLPEPGDVCLFGVRAEPGRPDAFDDVLGALYLACGKTGSPTWTVETWPGTTDPGLSILKRPVNAKGAAIVVPGYYAGLWRPGLHKKVHKALVQAAPVKVYRDRNGDARHDHDPSTIDTGYFGINAHDAYSAGIAQTVGGWSAGCQVWQRSSHLSAMLHRVNARPADFRKRPVSYALFRQSEVFAP